VQRPAETQLEMLFEAPAETSVQKPAETRVEESPDRLLERWIDARTETQVQTPAEKPAEPRAEEGPEPLLERWLEARAETRVETSAATPAETRVEKPAELQLERIVESRAETGAETPLTRVETPVETPAKRVERSEVRPEKRPETRLEPQTDRPFRVKLRGSVLVLIRLPNKRQLRAALHQLSTTGGVINLEKPLDEKIEVELIFHIDRSTIRGKAQMLFPMWATQGWMQPFRFIELTDANRDALQETLKFFIGNLAKSASAAS
jgi:hypothetical protein